MSALFWERFCHSGFSFETLIFVSTYWVNQQRNKTCTGTSLCKKWPTKANSFCRYPGRRKRKKNIKQTSLRHAIKNLNRKLFTRAKRDSTWIKNTTSRYLLSPSLTISRWNYLSLKIESRKERTHKSVWGFTTVAWLPYFSRKSSKITSKTRLVKCTCFPRLLRKTTSIWALVA